MEQVASLQVILERLAAGESPEDILVSVRSPGDRHLLRCCAVVRTFDRAIFDTVLAVATQQDALPSFDEFVQFPEVEPIPRAAEVYRLRRDARVTNWRDWWRDEPESSTAKLPGALTQLISRLIEHYRATGQEVDLLAQLALIDSAQAADLLEHLYSQADQRFHLATCQDLVDVLSDPDRSGFHGPRLTELRDDRAAYLRARSLWATDYHQTAGYMEPADTGDVYERLVGGHGPHWLQLHGPGGKGKTISLRWLIARQLVPERGHSEAFGKGRIPCAKVDFDFVDPVNATANPWLVLLEAAAQLNEQLPLAPFGEYLETYGWAAPLLRRNPVGRDRVNAASRRLASQRDRIARSAPRKFARTLKAKTASRPVVLVLDTLEEVHLRPQGDLAELLRLLSSLLDQCSTLRVILSGRYPIAEVLGAAASELPPMDEHFVGPFSAADADRYLESARGISRRTIRRAIVDKVGGDQFKLALMADIVQQQPRLEPAEIQNYEADLIYLILRIIRRIEDARIHWMLLYGAVPRTLTLQFVTDVMQPYLGRVMGEGLTFESPIEDLLTHDIVEKAPATRTGPLQASHSTLDLDELWKQLVRYAGATAWVSLVPDEPNAVRFRPDVIVPMRRLIGRLKECRALHEDAAEYFERKARQDPDRWDRWIREAIYHRFQLEGPSAARFWREAIQSVDPAKPVWRDNIAAELLGPDYVDKDGQPHKWSDDQPLVMKETLVKARFERASALTEIARTEGVAAHDQTWSLAEQNLAGVERGHEELGSEVIPQWRLAYVRAGLKLKEGDADAAETYLREVQGATRDPDYAARISTLLGDAQLAKGDRAAPRSYRRALRSARLLPSAQRWEPYLRGKVIGAQMEFDRLAEAYEECERALQVGPMPERPMVELLIMAAHVGLRSGHLDWADKCARRADRIGDWRARRALVLIELARYRVVHALQLMTTAEGLVSLANTSTGDSLTSSGQAASERELAGLATGALLQFDEAVEHLETGRTIWHMEGDLEAVARCYARSALLQMRELGNLHVAEQHLDEAERLELRSGSASWLELSLARTELLSRQGLRDQATTHVQAIIDELVDGHAAPRHFVRAAVAGLADGAPDRQAQLLRLIATQLRLVSSPSARVQLLEQCRRVGELAEDQAIETLREIRKMLSISRDDRLSTGDHARLLLILADVDRLTGNRTTALAELSSAREGLRSLDTWFYLREWSLAVDRVGASDRLSGPSTQEISAFLREFNDFPMLSAAFLIERAESALKTDQAQVPRLVELARPLVNTTPEQPNQWHARVLSVSAELERSRSAMPNWATYLGIAVSIFVALGDSVRAATAPLVARDDALAELESGRARVRLTLPGRSDLQVRTSVPPALETTELFTDQAWLVGDLASESSHQMGAELFSNEFMERLLEDWVAVGHDLGLLLLPGRSADALRSPRQTAVEFRLEIADRRLHAVPWELARLGDSGQLLALDQAVAAISRAVSKDAVTRDEVRFVQVALNHMLGAGLNLDDDFGPKTDTALREFQERSGLIVDGVVRHEVLARLQADLAQEPDRSGPPLVILAQPSESRQFQGHRGKASIGIDLEWVYKAHGYTVWEVENPTLDTLVGVVRKAVAHGRVPSIVHLSGGLRESGGGVAFTFLAGEWWSESLSGSRFSDDLSVTTLDRLLAQFPRDSFRPLVILDVDRPSAAGDTVEYLLLRNSFAGDVFALGKCPAVIATGLGRDVTDRFGPYVELVHLLAAGTPIGEACARVRCQADPTQDLESALPLAGIALFTHLPWLRIAHA